jgi:hypothetical protein
MGRSQGPTTARGWRGVSAWLALAGIVAVMAMLYRGWDLFTYKHRPLVRGLDDTYYFLWLPKLVIDHDLDFKSALQKCPMISERDRALELAVPPTATGLHYNKFPLGWALGSLPFYLVARGLAWAFHWGDNGWEPVYQCAVWLGQFGYALAGLFFGWKILARFFPPATAATAIVTGWLASPLVYYQTADLSVSHSQVFALVALASWLGLEIDARGAGFARFAVLGFATGLLAVTRFTAPVHLALPAVVLAKYAMGPAPLADRTRHLLVCFAGALAPLLIQGAAWKILYGTWTPDPYQGEHFDWVHPHLLQVLFSPLHGFFYWHPVMLVGIAAGAVWAWRRRLVWALILSFALTLILNAAWHCWWFGTSFGNRSFEATVLLAMAGLAWLSAKTEGRPLLRGLLNGVVALGVAWNLILLALFMSKAVPSEAAVTWIDAWKALAAALGS